MKISLTFLGAAGTVTGSKYLITIEGLKAKTYRILVDAGMFQGERKWREKNWEDPEATLLKHIDACLITHAHVDHVGILPRYVNLGLKCPVFCTKPTAELLELVLIDSARLQEEDAQFRRERGRSRHTPPLPLYTEKDALAALNLIRPVAFGKPVEIVDGLSAEWRHVGHILGAASVNVFVGGKQLTFSGDVGRYNVPILKDPEPVDFGDLLLIEGTYGDSLHAHKDPKPELTRVIKETYKRGGVLLIPSFAIGRTQTLLYYLRELKQEKQIPDLPVIVDSPMADDVTALYAKNPGDYDEEALGIMQTGQRPFSCSKLAFVKSRLESIKLNTVKEPMIIISASGMLSGGRVLHHLRHRLPHAANTILFVGFQAPGGRGAWIKSGAKEVNIFNETVPIYAKIEEISGLSAHADQADLLRWCASSKTKPSKVAVVHAEPEVAQKFKEVLKQNLNLDAFAATYKEEFEL